MTYKGYVGVVRLDEDAELFSGEVVNTRDVITFQGKSVDELKKAFRDSVDDYLDFCKSRNEEPEKPFSGRLTIRLSPERHRKIVLAAEQSGKEVNVWAAEVLAQAVGV